MSVLQRLFDRVVKVIHSKCIGKLPRRFKSCSSRRILLLLYTTKLKRFVSSVYHSESDRLFHVERFDVRAYFSDVKQQGRGCRWMSFGSIALHSNKNLFT
jgi:hypothetical protein